MFDWFLRKLARRPRRTLPHPYGATAGAHPGGEGAFSPDLDENLARLRALLATSDDIVYRRFTLPLKHPVSAAVVFVKGMVDTDALDDAVLRPLLVYAREAGKPRRTSPQEAWALAKTALLTGGEPQEIGRIDEAARCILAGQVLLLIDGTAAGLLVGIGSREKRPIEQPVSQSIIRGPRDGFTEDLQTNLVLVRRRLADPALSVETLHLGRRSRTKVAVLYIRDIADSEIVAEVKARLARIDIDAILESGYIEQLIEENWWTVFPTVQDTERPDQVAGGLLEGRVAVLVDTTPFALLVPATVPMFLTSPEDMYFRWNIATLIRMLRYAGAFLSLTLPSAYVALTSYHPGMLPTNLELFIAAAREAVPFPAFFEALIMEMTLELLREAGLRLPSPIGQTLGIVGAIIIGEAAVRAGLVSPIMVVAVAATAVASFVIPTYSFAIALRILRFGLLFLAAVGGLFGLVMGLLFVLAHLSILTSFGVPYLAPFAPLQAGDWRDTWVRVPWIRANRRPSFLRPADPTRQSGNTAEDDPAQRRDADG